MQSYASESVTFCITNTKSSQMLLPLKCYALDAAGN